MPKKEIDLEMVSQPEVKVSGSERLSSLSWLCHHAGQIVKGSAALVGLAMLGGVGYLASGAVFNTKKTSSVSDAAFGTKTRKTDEHGLVIKEPDSAVAKIRSKGLVNFGDETRVSMSHDAADIESTSIADGKIDFSDDAEVRENAGTIAEIVTPGVKRSLMQLPDDRSALAVRDNSLAKIWAKAFGGIKDDLAYSVEQTTDGGYIVAGYTASAGAGNKDFLIFKLNSFGVKVWAKTFGGAADEEANSIQRITDGGYIVAGYTSSIGAGNGDFLILKLDSSGNKVWTKTYGGTRADVAYSVQQTTDGGYIVAGTTESAGAGNYDFLVLKLDGSGNEVWAKTFGGAAEDGAYSVQQITDGGYIVAGYTYSAGAGKNDFLVLKLDNFGNKVWAKTFGGAEHDKVYSVQQTVDGGYIAVGYTYSAGAGNFDFLVLKLDGFGNNVWAKTFGGLQEDSAQSVQQTTDGGYIVAGFTYSNKGTGFDDVLLLKLDDSGNKVWAKTFGGTKNNEAYSIQQTTDGGYIVAGYTASVGAGLNDFLVLKLDANGNLKDGCWGQDVLWQTVDAGLILGDVPWTTQNATLTLASADTLTLADWNLTTTIICVRNPTLNIPISTQTSCCSARVGQTYSFTFVNNTFTDPEDGALIYTATLDVGGVLPSWLKFDPIAQTFSGVPSVSDAGNLPAKVTATNPSQGSIFDTFVLNIAQTLSATNISAIINYIENTECKLATIVITTPNANVTATLTLSNITAGNFTTGTSSSVTSTFNPATGVWQASGNLADVNYLLAGLKYRPAFDYHGGFSVAVKIDDSLGQSLNSTLTAPALAVPTLVCNPFTILVGGNVILTPSIISAEDASVPASALVFTVSNMQHGRFELAGAPGTAIATFNQQQIINGQVKIVQDNSDNAPQFNLKVNNGAASSPSTNIVNVLHHNTVLIAAEIRIGNGESLVINLNMLNARNPDDTPEQLTFSIVNIQNGRFEFLDNPGIIINQFTLREIIDGRVRLGHDASSNPPIFSVSVSDAFVTTTPVEVRTKFKENAPAPDGTPITETFRNIAVGATGSGIAAVGFWVIRKKYSTRKKRKTYPLEDGIRKILNLGVSDFDSAKGKEFLQTVKILAKKLRQEQGINTKTLTHEELRGLADPVAKAIRQHEAVKTSGRGIFRSNSIDHDKVRNAEVSGIVQDVAAMWRETGAAAEAARPRDGELHSFAVAAAPGTIEELKEPLISSNVGSP